MVTRRSRSVYAVLLAFALLPIVSMVAGGSGARAQAAMAGMQWQAKSQSLDHGVRAGLGELARHHAFAMPFAPAEAFRLVLSAPPAAGTASAESIAVAAMAATLHPAW